MNLNNFDPAVLDVDDRIADVEWMEDVVSMSAPRLAEKYQVSERQAFRWKALAA